MAIFKPFKIIGQIFPVFLFFVIANIVLGQIGILASMALDHFSNKQQVNQHSLPTLCIF